MSNSKKRKQLLLRLSPELYDELAAWADDEFRSLNGQVEYLLTKAVRKERRRLKNDAEDAKKES